MINTFVSIDLETTGLNPRRDRIIEIGALKVVDGEVREQFASLVNPGRKLEPEIAELTGIRDRDLEEAPKIGEIVPELFCFLGEYTLLGHSVLFDYSFLKKAAVDYGRSFEREGIDTLKIARKYLAQLESRSLKSLCLYYQIPHHAHRALEDAGATFYLYQKLAEHFYREDEELFMPRSLHCRIKRDTPATGPQKERLYCLLSRHKIEPDMDIESLTRSEASRLTDKILARYGR